MQPRPVPHSSLAFCSYGGRTDASATAPKDGIPVQVGRPLSFIIINWNPFTGRRRLSQILHREVQRSQKAAIVTNPNRGTRIIAQRFLRRQFTPTVTRNSRAFPTGLDYPPFDSHPALGVCFIRSGYLSFPLRHLDLTHTHSRQVIILAAELFFFFMTSFFGHSTFGRRRHGTHV